MKQGEIIEIGAIALGALALFIVLKRGGTDYASQSAPASAPSSFDAYGTPPYYLGYNQPTTYSPNSLAGQSAAPSSGTQQPCACAAGPVQYANLQSYSNYLSSVDESLVNKYQQNIASAMPSWMGQFINNTFAPEQTAAAQGKFSSFMMGGG